MIYLIQLTGLAGLLRYQYAKARDERYMCGLAVALAFTFSLLNWGAW